MVLPTQRSGTSTSGEKRGWRLFDFLMEERPSSASRRRDRRSGGENADQQETDQKKDSRESKEKAKDGNNTADAPLHSRAEAWRLWRQASARPRMAPAHARPAATARDGSLETLFAYTPPSGPALFSDEVRLRRLIERCRAVKSPHARRVLVYCLAVHALHTPKTHQVDVAV